MATTSDLLFLYQSSANDQLDDILTSGGSSTELEFAANAVGNFGGLAINAAAGVYFVTTVQTNVGSFIYEETFGKPLTFNNPVGGGPLETTLDDQVSSLALDPTDDKILYFTAGTGFYEEKFSLSNYSGTETQTKLATLPTATDAANQQIVFDQKDNSAYFAAPSIKFSFNPTTPTVNGSTQVGGVKSNFIYKVTGVGGADTVSSVNLGPGNQLPLADGAISGIALDTADDTLFIITRPYPNTGAHPTSSETAGLYTYKIGGTGVKTIWSEHVTSTTPSLTDMTYITVDPTTDDYYITDASSSRNPGIYSGTLADTNANQLTLLFKDPTNGDTTAGVAIDPPPTISSTAVTAIDGNTSKTTGTVTTADTVTISVTFNESVTITGTPALALNDGGSAVYKSGAGSSTLVFTYTPSGGQNIATLASTGAVSGGTITDLASTPADLTNAAATFTGLRVETTKPTLSVTGTTSDVVQGAGTATTLLQSEFDFRYERPGHDCESDDIDRQRSGGRRAVEFRRRRHYRHRKRQFDADTFGRGKRRGISNIARCRNLSGRRDRQFDPRPSCTHD